MLTSGRMTEASQWGNRTSLKAGTKGGTYLETTDEHGTALEAANSKGGTFLEPVEVKTERLWRPVGTEVALLEWSGKKPSWISGAENSGWRS